MSEVLLSSEHQSLSLPELHFTLDLTDDLQFRYLSEAIDYRDKFYEYFRPLERPIMQAFRDITHGEWKDYQKRYGIRVGLSPTKGSKSSFGKARIRLGYRDHNPYARMTNSYGEVRTYESLALSLIHELGHPFEDESDHMIIMNTINERVDHNQLSKKEIHYIAHEIYTELLWKEIVDKIFTEDTVSKFLIRRRNSGRLYKEAFKIIDGMTVDEKKIIIDRRRGI